jgi:hypothetical protein
MDADSGLHSSKFPRWKVGVAWSADDHFWREAVISIYFDLSSIGRAVELVVF